MNREELNDRLSRISTMWTVLRAAHEGPPDMARAAQQLLVERYGGAVRRYLARALGDSHAADDLTQEFAISLVRGDFRNVQPERGRFRSYIKTVLFHLVSGYRKRDKKLPQPLSSDSPELAELVAPDDAESNQFDESWRDELLRRAWDALSQIHPTFYGVLRIRTQQPELSSSDLVELVTQQLGKPMTAGAIRQSLHRAREQFADLLVEEVAHSLTAPTPDLVEQELADLNLLDYCRPALERRDLAGN